MNAYELYMDRLFAKANKQGIPLSGTFELTARCNLNCRMCYIHEQQNDPVVKTGELPGDDWIRLADQCRSAGMLHLLLTGGEPMLRADFGRIYAACRQMGLLVSVNTNGTLLTEEILTLFQKYPPARVNVTLYGASSDTYGNLCQNAAAYEKVKEAISSLKKAGILVKLNCSVTQYNQQDLGKIMAYAKEENLELQVATYMYPPVRACEQGACHHERMSPKDSARAQVAYEKLRFSGEECGVRWQNKLQGIRPADEMDACQEQPAQKISCRAGSTTFWVTWDGRLRPCAMMTAPQENLKKMDFLQAWDCLRRAASHIPVPPACTQCQMRDVCDQCPAVCQAESGKYESKPEYMCQRTMEYLAQIRKELNKQI